LPEPVLPMCRVLALVFAICQSAEIRPALAFADCDVGFGRHGAKPAATPAIEKVPVVLDLLQWIAEAKRGKCVWANRRDNGGWFSESERSLSYHRAENGRAGRRGCFIKRPVGRRFLPLRRKSWCLASVVVAKVKHVVLRLRANRSR